MAASWAQQGPRICRRRGAVLRGHARPCHYRGLITVASIPAFAYEDRTICEICSNNPPAEVLAWPQPRRLCRGGPPVWQTYAPFIQHWDITRLPYDGEADRWFDPAWLVASKNGARVRGTAESSFEFVRPAGATMLRAPAFSLFPFAFERPNFSFRATPCRPGPTARRWLRRP